MYGTVKVNSRQLDVGPLSVPVANEAFTDIKIRSGRFSAEK